MNSAVQARTPDRCSSSITISPGDTLSSIARHCGTTLSALIDANPHLHDPNILPVGMALVLPQGPQGDEASPIEAVAEAHIISVEPSVLTPGGRVVVAASNLPPEARVWIKGGTSRSPKHHLILRGARVDAQGKLHAGLRLPHSLRAGDEGFTLSIEVPRASMTFSSDPLDVNERYAAGEVR
ncbi:LysM peptidoglycan-binding domain-containing protein [Microvirga pakistanensis]|uniref:LysM peptidoglycan-binding domain-containing protein n=1 Tax=Microvirga pakistanensis TaxID=1682650 RepID=UPI00106C595A|nr:LysM peptidoglycan-binding domain-containing protein [Microvirga pakistanensis]